MYNPGPRTYAVLVACLKKLLHTMEPAEDDK